MDIKEIDSIEILVPIFIETFNANPWNESWTCETATLSLTELRSNRYFYGLVCLEGENPIGAIMGNIRTFSSSKSFYIDHLFVLERYRLKKIGTNLYVAAINNLVKKGVTGAFFTTLKNSGAYHFYVKNGAIDLQDSSVMYHPFGV